MLSGVKLFVLAGDEADLIICPATDADGKTSLFVVEAGSAGVSRKRLPTLDITRPLSEVRLERVVVPHANLLWELAAPTWCSAGCAISPRSRWGSRCWAESATCGI